MLGRNPEKVLHNPVLTEALSLKKNKSYSNFFLPNSVLLFNFGSSS